MEQARFHRGTGDAIAERVADVNRLLWGAVTEREADAVPQLDAHVAALAAARATRGIVWAREALSVALALRGQPGDLDRAVAQAQLVWSDVQRQRGDRYLLAALAVGFARAGHAERALRLQGHVDASRRRQGGRLWPCFVRLRKAVIAVGRRSLPPERVAALLAAGETLPTERASAMAFEGTVERRTRSSV
jgi:hypothetical protein